MGWTTLLATTVPFGTLPSWLTLGGFGFFAYVLRRGAAGPAITILQAANKVLTERVSELEAQVKEYAEQVVKLSARTDFALALKPVMDWTVNHEEVDAQRFAGVAAAIDAHESNAAARSEKLLQALGLIVDRLGAA